ncbi:unnamed protein product [Periconia digitata]|uniref:Cyclin-D1-binding protein 1-like N-terminal domain-containing protein n=1 Tax=Periconia digitata TaxID=1303443 RepID=A0A9W4XQR2_9PLEO|nr:unnamed protein product [Periconia digitata]
MPPPNTLRALIDVTKTTQALLSHYQASLSPPNNTSSTTATAAGDQLASPLDTAKACTTLLKSHTTTLSLLLLTPPLTPSALITKIGDVSSSVLSGLVAAAVTGSDPITGNNSANGLGSLMKTELRGGVLRVLAAWGEVLTLVLRLAERRQSELDGKADTRKKKDEGPTEAERQSVLATTGMVWEACDALLKFCDNGIVGLVVKKAEEWRSVLLDAVEELKEWGEDVDGEEDELAGSDDEFADDDDIFGAANKLGKEDVKLKALLDTSVKKLKMVGMLYQALIKRRLKTFPKSPSKPTASTEEKNGGGKESQQDVTAKLEQLMVHLRAVPEGVDDLASAFYDLDEGEAKVMFDKCCSEAKKAVAMVRQSWNGTDDEFTVWSGKWVNAVDAE